MNLGHGLVETPRLKRRSLANANRIFQGSRKLDEQGQDCCRDAYPAANPKPSHHVAGDAQHRFEETALILRARRHIDQMRRQPACAGDFLRRRARCGDIIRGHYHKGEPLCRRLQHMPAAEQIVDMQHIADAEAVFHPAHHHANAAPRTLPALDADQQKPPAAMASQKIGSDPDRDHPQDDAGRARQRGRGLSFNSGNVQSWTSRRQSAFGA